MKVKSTITSLFLLFCMILSAQTDQKVLVEHFTNTVCSICASKNPDFFSHLENHPNVIHISFHPSSPYSSCQFNQFDKESNDARTQFYNIYGATPRFVVNGNLESNNTMAGDDDPFPMFAGMESDVEMSVDHTKFENQVVVEVTINPLTQNLGNGNLFVGLVEDVVAYSAPNGENTHYNVFRIPLTTMDGDPVDLNQSGPFTVELTADVESNWQYENYKPVVILSQGTNYIQSATQDAKGVVVSNDETANNPMIDIFPNPTNGIVNINEPSVTGISVMDHSGKLLETITDLKNVIDLSHLPSGNYFLQIRLHNDRVVIKKITRL